MKFLNLFFAIGLLFFLFGCGQNDKNADLNKSLALQDITSKMDTSEGFVDIYLTIINETTTDTSHIYIAKGLYNGKIVGFQFDVKSNMINGITSEGEINTKEGFNRNAVKIASLGQESDEFLKGLAELYKISTKRVFTKSKISTTAFSLNQNTADLNKGNYYKFKLFFNEDGDEETYAELFFNIDTDKNIIELHEKDPDYRIPLIRAFTTN